MSKKLLSFFPAFVAALEEQLEVDDARWGNTWATRPAEGQEDRTYARFTDYYDQWRHSGEPIPWLKIAGGAFICWVREQ